MPDTLQTPAGHVRLGSNSGQPMTRRDGVEFLELAPKIPVRTRVELFPLIHANEALSALRHGDIRGAIVLQVRLKC